MIGGHVPVEVKNVAILRLVVAQDVLELLLEKSHHRLVMVAREEGVGPLHLVASAVLARRFGRCRAD